MTQEHLSIISKIVEEKIYVPEIQKKVTVFLCGADKNDASTGRYMMANMLSKHPRFEVHYPEDLFDDLLVGKNQHSLLSLENILAESVDVIVLFPESPGSFAELGAFANNPTLAQKLICLPQKKYKNKKSFINYGPNRLIKESRTGKVIDINYNDFGTPDEAEKLYKRVNAEIAKIKKKHPVNKNVGNILEAEYFLLPCIYLVEKIDNVSLYGILKAATQKDKSLCEIATKCALSRLVGQRLITRTLDGYTITSEGGALVRKKFDNKNLDRVRLEIMNYEMRRNSNMTRDRLIAAHL